MLFRSGGHPSPGGAVREDLLESAGVHRARFPLGSIGRQEGQESTEHRYRFHPDAAGRRVVLSGHLFIAAPASGILYGRWQGSGRGPAAESGQKCDSGITEFWVLFCKALSQRPTLYRAGLSVILSSVCARGPTG